RADAFCSQCGHLLRGPGEAVPA
ncbi:MAG: hypothetical protein QOH62_3089, partial [Solirubrobacteraceae bacterium]|nr:hypothetical protein [Solirubrobacteraceae bacterium]